MPNQKTTKIRTTTTTTKACAACRFQRRKCGQNCILAPYFPQNHHRQFHNAHKLFGVSNLTKLICNLDNQQQKDEAMRSIIYEADVRAIDPVGGCYRIIRDLRAQIETSRAELEFVLQRLAFYQTLDVHNQTQNDDNEKNDDEQILIDYEIDYDFDVKSETLEQCKEQKPVLRDFSSLLIKDENELSEVKDICSFWYS